MLTTPFLASSLHLGSGVDHTSGGVHERHRPPRAFYMRLVYGVLLSTKKVEGRGDRVQGRAWSIPMRVRPSLSDQSQLTSNLYARDHGPVVRLKNSLSTNGPLYFWSLQSVSIERNMSFSFQKTRYATHRGNSVDRRQENTGCHKVLLSHRERPDYPR